MAKKAGLRDRVVVLAGALERALAPPSRTRNDRVAHDAWREALRPYGRPLLRRAARLADRAAWEIDVAGRPVRLRAALWPRLAAEVAALAAELTTALKDHRGFVAAFDGAGRLEAVRGKAGGRAPDGLSERRRLARAETALEKVRAALDACREEVRATVAALQEAEELRLAERVRALPEHTADREQAEDLLLDLAQGRLDTKRDADERPAVWGSHLRRAWLRPRARLVRLLEG